MNKSSLIYKENNKLVLNQTALNKIKSINDDIAVCSIIGSYRSGKSTLLTHLNQLFHEKNGLKFDKKTSSFEIGHSDLACTKGLNICESMPIIRNKSGESFKLLLIDTEGLDSDDSKESCDIKIFLASLLISSVFMFNGLKTLNKQDFNRLSLVTILSEKIKIKKNMAQSLNKKELKNELPDFIWLVRDFSLSLEKSKDEYLNRFLEFEDYPEQDDPKKNADIDKRNQIKENLIDSFRTIDCSLLKQPILGEDKLQKLDSLNLSDLRKEYLNDLNELVDKINLILHSKEINGQKLNGPLFAEYLKLIVESINSEKTIFLHETVSLALNAMADQNLNECLNLFDKEIQQISSSSNPMKYSEHENKIKQSEEKSLNHLTSYFKSINNKTLFDEYKRKLETKLDEKCIKFKDENIKKIREKDLSSALIYWKSKFNYTVEERYRTTVEFEKEIDNFKKEFIENKLFDKDYKAHLDEQFWNEVFNHKDVNITGLKEKIIQKENERKQEELRQARQQSARCTDHESIFSDFNDFISPMRGFLIFFIF